MFTEIVAAIVLWTATLAFAQFGIDVNLTRSDASRTERTVERTAPAATGDCPDATSAWIRPI